MNILLLGSGGREHALAWKIAASPLYRQALLRARQCRHRAARPNVVALDLADHEAVIAFCQGQAHRFRRGRARGAAVSPALSTISRPPASRRSGRPRRPRAWKAQRASPRTCAQPTISRPPPMSASTARAAAQRTMCARKARRSWSRPTAWPPAKAWWSRETVAGGGSRDRHDVRRRLRRGRQRSRDRGISRRRRGLLLRALRRRDRDPARLRAGSQARLRRRQGAEHRRHGRLFAGADHDRRHATGARWTRSSGRPCAR